MVRYLAFITVFISSITYSFAQVGINNNGANPDPSAMLDVKSNTKGMLIPRMTAVERQTILDPAQGLMVFDQTNNAFYYFNGIGWLELLAGTVTELKDANGDTKIQVEETIDDDIIRFDIEGVERIKMEQNRIEVVNNNDNIFIGDDAGSDIVTGDDNIAIGTSSLDSLTSGYGNIALGRDVLKNNTTGEFNFGAGDQTLQNNTNGRQNVAIGVRAMFENTTGRDNVGMGYYVLNKNTTGNHNVAIGNFVLGDNTIGIQNMGVGNYSLSYNITGDNNSAFGNYCLVENTTGDNNSAFGHQALIENVEGSGNSAVGYKSDVLSSTLRKATAIGTEAKVGCDNCLVLGEIDSISVGIGTSFPDEKLHIVGNFKMVDGNQQDGHVLTSDANGKATWQSLGSITDNQTLSFDGTNLTIDDGNTVDISDVNTIQDIISDADNDTKIQLEESADEDILRIDINGAEKLILQSVGTNNIAQLSFTNSLNNTFIGDGVGENTTSGIANTVIGSQSFSSNKAGVFNVVMGANSLNQNIDGSRNIALGYNSLSFNKVGNDNIGMGERAGWLNENGDENIFIGANTGLGQSLHNKFGNVMIGHRSGESNEGDGNVFLGYQSGGNASGNNKLYIENSNTNSPLIYGEFDNNLIRVNGDLEVTGTFPGSDDQNIDTLNLNGSILEISLENDGEQKLTLDLSDIDTDTDDQTLSFDGTSISISEGNSVDISTLDTDNQSIAFDGLNLSITNGNSINISSIDTDNQEIGFDSNSNIFGIENGNTVDLSSINTDEQTLSYDDTDQSITISGGNTLDLTQLAVPVGAMMMWYTSTPPDGWLICDGTSFNATTYPALNTILGGNTLPDLIGRFALGSGERNEGSSHPLTSTGGFETVQLNEQNIPAHTHHVTIGYREGHENGQGQDYSDLGASSSDHNANKTYETDSWGGVTGNPDLILPHANMPPFLTVNYIIKAK